MGKIPKKIGDVPNKRPKTKSKQKYISYPRLNKTISELESSNFLNKSCYYSHKKNEIMGKNKDKLINFFEEYIEENNEIMDNLDELVDRIDQNYKEVAKLDYNSKNEIMKNEFSEKEKFKENIEGDILNRLCENNNITEESKKYAKERMVGSIRFINGLIDDGDILINKSEAELDKKIKKMFKDYINLNGLEEKYNFDFPSNENSTLENISTKKRISYIENKIEDYFLKKELKCEGFSSEDINALAKIGLIKIKNASSFLETIEGTYLLKKENLLEFNKLIDEFYNKIDYACSNLTEKLVLGRLHELGGYES